MRLPSLRKWMDEQAAKVVDAFRCSHLVISPCGSLSSTWRGVGAMPPCTPVLMRRVRSLSGSASFPWSWAGCRLGEPPSFCRGFRAARCKQLCDEHAGSYRRAFALRPLRSRYWRLCAALPRRQRALERLAVGAIFASSAPSQRDPQRFAGKERRRSLWSPDLRKQGTPHEVFASGVIRWYFTLIPWGWETVPRVRAFACRVRAVACSRPCLCGQERRHRR